VPGTDARAELRGWVQDDIDAACLGEEYRFDVACRIVVAASPAGQHAVSYRIAIWRANPVLGEPPLMTGWEYDGPVPREYVSAFVKSALGSLRSLNSRLLSVAGNGKA